MISSTVSNNPDAPLQTTTAPTTTPTTTPADAAELAALKAEVAENKRATEFWYAKATQQSAPPPAPEPAQEEVEEVDMLDLLSTQGVKGFDKFMKSRGYVSKAEVDAAVNSKAQQLSAEAELIASYPDLRKPDSEFFRATAAAYGELKKQGVPEALAMKLAAQQAEYGQFKAGKIRSIAGATDDAKAQREANRLARIKAQSGDKTSRTVETDDDDTDDELNVQELHICEAMGITPEAYKARALKGVQMGMGHMPAGKPKKVA